MKRYIVICEGRSEYVYIERLQSFLDGLSVGWDVPLQFFPKIARTSSGFEKGGGDYRSVVAGYRWQRKKNKTAHIEVWVDHDIYLRNDRNNRDMYLAKPPGIPDFRFSFHNFEDFLVMHMENRQVQVWQSIFEPKGHFGAPLHSRDYEPLFQQIMPEYRKGFVSPDFISVGSLLRLRQNTQKPIISHGTDPKFGSFAGFLIGQLEEAYPALFAGNDGC